MKNTFLITCVFFTFMLLPSHKAFSYVLSPEAEVTLLTASPGDELYSVFGHSAVRINDPANAIDVVFNYGTFDFNTPNFYMQFVRGKLLYKLSTSSMEHFVPEYYMEGRALYEQVLNLTQPQKQLVFDFLLWNSEPENAYYHYDFFYDNCATRIRDLVDDLLHPQWAHDEVIGSEVMGSVRSKLNYEYDYQPDSKPKRSFRDLLQPFLLTMPWSTFGIDIALGLPADKIADPYNYMYLPDEMLIAFARAKHQDGSPLVSSYRIILSKELPLSPAGFLTPLKVFWFLFVMACLSFLSPRFSRLFDLAFFNTLGITGLVILFLWFLSDHITTKANLNILWAIPTHLYYIWVASYYRNRTASILYFRIVFAISLILLVFWPLIPQGFNAAFFPIILTVLIKSLPYSFNVPYLSKYLTNKGKTA